MRHSTLYLTMLAGLVVGVPVPVGTQEVPIRVPILIVSPPPITIVPPVKFDPPLRPIVPLTPVGSSPPPPPKYRAIPIPIYLPPKAEKIKDDIELVLDLHELLTGENRQAKIWAWVEHTAHALPVFVTMPEATFSRAEAVKQLVKLEVKAATMVADQLHRDIEAVKASRYRWQQTDEERRFFEYEARIFGAAVESLKQQAIQEARPSVDTHWEYHGDSFEYVPGPAMHQLISLSIGSSSWD